MQQKKLTLFAIDLFFFDFAIRFDLDIGLMFKFGSRRF